MNWKKDPVVRLAKCIATRVHIELGLRGAALDAKVRELMPGLAAHVEKTQGRTLSVNTLGQRADKALRYPNEHPWRHSAFAPYWRLAGEIVEREVPIDVAEIGE